MARSADDLTVAIEDTCVRGRLLCVRLRPSQGVCLKHTSVARLREMDSAA